MDAGLSFRSDKKRIYIVLNNLISNAIKYSDPSKPEAYIKTLIDSSENGGARIRITDNGEGIDTQNINRIFDMSIAHRKEVMVLELDCISLKK